MVKRIPWKALAGVPKFQNAKLSPTSPKQDHYVLFFVFVVVIPSVPRTHNQQSQWNESLWTKLIAVRIFLQIQRWAHLCAEFPVVLEMLWPLWILKPSRKSGAQVPYTVQGLGGGGELRTLFPPRVQRLRQDPDAATYSVRSKNKAKTWSFKENEKLSMKYEQNSSSLSFHAA